MGASVARVLYERHQTGGAPSIGAGRLGPGLAPVTDATCARFRRPTTRRRGS